MDYKIDRETIDEVIAKLKSLVDENSTAQTLNIMLLCAKLRKLEPIRE